MNKIIINSTPIISLGNLKLLEIFRLLYGQVTIPYAVFREVMAKDDIAFDQLLENLSWINVAKCPSFDRNLFPENLHAGEIEAIVLAQSLNADLIILDDNNARKTAKNFGLKVMGTVGTLMIAKEQGFLDAVKPIIMAMCERSFRLSEKIFKEVLEQVGES